MNTELAEIPEPAKAALRAYAGEHRLIYFERWSMPEATQLLRHGFMREVPDVAIGDLPGGLAKAYLAHVDYAFTHGSDIRRRYFTLVLVPAPASANFAARVLCHDRDLTELDVSNPDDELQMVPMDDRTLKFESEALLKRYSLSTDHDQDQLRAWQLFDPRLIDWLTREAPDDFSFELQDGALACFVPEVIADADGLDGLCRATATVHRRVIELGEELEASVAPAVGGPRDTRAEVIERKLAEHPFTEPPESVSAAARQFGHWPLIGDEDWKLGAEAFFRAYATALGLKRLDPTAFRASHLELFIPGFVTQVAQGPLPPEGLDGYLIWTTDDEEGWGDVCWTVLLADVPEGSNTYAFTQLPDADAADKKGFDIAAGTAYIAVWKPDPSPKKRNRKLLAEFLETAAPLLTKAVEASRM
jgi:hypothetical protein